MPPLPLPRLGTRLEVKRHVVPFSFWPVTRTTRRFGLQDNLFSSSPWTVMRAATRSRAPAARRSEALAFIDQAEEFFLAASARPRANPLLLYYAFLNVAKALIVVQGGAVPALDRAAHGIIEQTAPGGRELRDSTLNFPQTAGRPNVFRGLAGALGLVAPALSSSVPVMDLLPQIVIGHRLFRSAVRSTEGFLNVQEIRLMENVPTNHVWADLIMEGGRMSRYDLSGAHLLNAGSLSGHFREVLSSTREERRFEMIDPISYGDRPTDRLYDVVRRLRSVLWRGLSSNAPYRAYYICLAQSGRMPQMLSMYALLFYFGSITRYRPHIYDSLLGDPLGAFVIEFVATVADQLAYMLASEMAQREVIRAF